MLGPAYASAQHRHHAAQIAFGLDGPVIFESPHTGVHRADMLLISPNTAHAHPAFGPLAFLCLWPESTEWGNFPGQKNGGIVPLPFNLQLRSIARSAAGGDAAAAQLLVDQFDWKVRKQCSKRRCFSLSRRRSDQPESRRADHAGGCGKGDAPISLTEAAHMAGFADSAHLSRTFRATFGVTPSLLFKPGQIKATFCETAAST
jgi:AraC family transcriptional regulator